MGNKFTVGSQFNTKAGTTAFVLRKISRNKIEVLHERKNSQGRTTKEILVHYSGSGNVLRDLSKKDYKL